MSTTPASMERALRMLIGFPPRGLFFGFIPQRRLSVIFIGIVSVYLNGISNVIPSSNQTAVGTLNPRR